MFLKNLKTLFVLLVAVASTSALTAQSDLGEACGCPNVGERGTTALSTLADADGNLLSTNTILSCETIWTIDDKIYVGDGQSITIQPGTALKGALGTAGDANALIVSRGGQIFAPGTRECPIVFTAVEDPLDGSYGIENKGKWGGVVVLGKAKNNLKFPDSGTLAVADGVGFIEGFVAAEARNQFGMPPGMEDDNDNSGIMTYVSIRHAGDIAGEDNELNGLTLGSVGKGTTLSNIEIVSNLDDGIEFFGGSVDLKYASVLFNDDDGFDWDLGWSGRGQFWVVVKTDQGTADGGDNGFEADGDDSDDALFYASPTVYNATFIGSQDINGSDIDDTDIAMELKEATRGAIRNSILANYGTAIRVSGEAAPAHEGLGDTYDLLFTTGELVLENNTFVNCGQFLAGRAGAPVSEADSITLANAGNAFVASLPGFQPAHTMNVSNNSVTEVHDLVPEPAVATSTLPPVDGFFSPADYRGAFEAGKKPWLSFYSVNALLGLAENLNECATDITGDGITNASDFLELLGAFGQRCN